MLMPSASTTYTVGANSYTSDGNKLVYNALAADIPGLTALGGVTLAPRNNVSGSTPTASNDYTQLYGVGSLWTYTGGTNPTVYVCTAMGPTPGTATWTTVLSSSSLGDVSAGTVIPTGATTARSLANLFADAYNNVKTFGAAGNGSTDDTAAINAAITEAGVNGQPVYFPSGTYKVTSQIQVDLNALGATANGLWLIGDGMARS